MSLIEDFELHVDERMIEQGVAVGCLLLTGISNRGNSPGFASVRAAALRHTIENETFNSVTAHSHLQAYRDLHAHFGIKDPKLTPSPESLFAALFRHGDLRSINRLVDIYTTVSLTHVLSCGAHDLERLSDRIALQPTTGSESFRALGESQEKSLPVDEYAYFDGGNRVICRLECRQGAHSALTEDTRNVAFIVQGNAAVPQSAIENAVTEIAALVRRWVGEPQQVRQIMLPESISDFAPAIRSASG